MAGGRYSRKAFRLVSAFASSISVSVVAAGAPLILVSCDLLRTAPFRVVSWTPGAGRFEAGDDLSVRVVFSEEPDRVSAENSFSITEDGVPLPGAFSWEGSAMTFIPFMPLGRNSSFRVTVDDDAMTVRGVSLDEPLEGRFATKAEDGRPSIVSTTPGRGGILSDTGASVVVEFSEPVDPVSYRSCLSFSPSIAGVWKLLADGATAVFDPLEPWEWGREYEGSIRAELEDDSQNRMGQDYSFRFTVGDDGEAPRLAGADALDALGAVAMTLIVDGPVGLDPAENAGWEARWRLRLRFDEPVATRTLESRVVSEGGPALRLETDTETSASAIFRFEERPEFGSRFTVRVRAGVEDVRGNASAEDIVIRILADGDASKPPRLVGIRLPLAPGAASPEDLDLAVFSLETPFATMAIADGESRYPLGVPTETSIELYFELAIGANLDLLSLMESFGVSSTNGSLDFSAASVSLAGLPDAAPHHPWEAYALARFEGTLTNRVGSGVVTFRIASGFKDSVGNRAEAQSLPLLK